MSQFDKLSEWLKFFNRDDELRLWFERQPLPQVTFSKVRNVDKPPSNDSVAVNTFYFVSPANLPKWVLFRCPCGCNSVITLSLQQAHRPHWVLSRSKKNQPILYPSVWRDTGCMSHFWIHYGRVYWCGDTGTSPFTRSFSN